MRYAAVRPFILVGEDDEDCARAVSVILSEQYDVAVRGTGREIVASCEIERPDLLILDYELPDMNGVRIVEALRRHCELDMPVLMMSAYSNRRDAALRAGFVLFLPKPFGRAEMLQAVERAIQKSM
jgi:CheY-like chemotaxis protein